MQENQQEELKKLYKDREVWRTKIFYITLEIAIVFGVLAFGTLGIAKYLESNFQTNKSLSFVILGIAFVLGWAWVIYRYRKVKAEVDNVEAKIKGVQDQTE